MLTAEEQIEIDTAKTAANKERAKKEIDSIKILQEPEQTKVEIYAKPKV